ncbi:hypothetical protein M885DRAFT_514540 [Pelagophyceae sp. CCMP2097]|nr:hypothetical protein M885DRAFT_514540 [Pelagophyceae sp. CCMP2097]
MDAAAGALGRSADAAFDLACTEAPKVSAPPAEGKAEGKAARAKADFRETVDDAQRFLASNRANNNNNTNETLGAIVAQARVAFLEPPPDPDAAARYLAAMVEDAQKYIDSLQRAEAPAHDEAYASASAHDEAYASASALEEAYDPACVAEDPACVAAPTCVAEAPAAALTPRGQGAVVLGAVVAGAGPDGDSATSGAPPPPLSPRSARDQVLEMKDDVEMLARLAPTLESWQRALPSDRGAAGDVCFAFAVASANRGLDAHAFAACDLALRCCPHGPSKALRRRILERRRVCGTAEPTGPT